jgi:hypothetical protein
MTSVDVQSIEHLDFEPVFPCESSQHPTDHPPDEPAKFEIESNCPGCKKSKRWLICNTGYARLCTMRTHCSGCKMKFPPGKSPIRIVRMLGGS